MRESKYVCRHNIRLSIEMEEAVESIATQGEKAFQAVLRELVAEALRNRAHQRMMNQEDSTSRRYSVA